MLIKTLIVEIQSVVTAKIESDYRGKHSLAFTDFANSDARR